MNVVGNYVHLCKTIAMDKLAHKGLTATPYPFRLNMAVTYRCNYQCRMCSIWKIYRYYPNTEKEELDLHDYDALFETLSPHLFWLGLTGGEPFLKKELADIVFLAYSKLRKAHILELTTNGFSPNLIERTMEKILSTTKFPFLTLGVSVDGPSSMHDDIRGVKGAWNNAIGIYKKLSSLSHSYPNFSPHLSYTISQYNAGNFARFAQILHRDVGISLNSISVTIENMGHLYHRKGDTSPFQASIIRKIQEDIHFLLKRVDATAPNPFKGNTIEVGKHLFKKVYLANALKYLNNPKKLVMPCAAAISSCFIDPFGYVYPCTVYGRQLGNVKNSDFAEIWNSYTANKLRNLIKLGHCPICWSPCEAEPSFLLNLPKSLVLALTNFNMKEWSHTPHGTHMPR